MKRSTKFTRPRIRKQHHRRAEQKQRPPIIAAPPVLLKRVNKAAWEEHAPLFALPHLRTTSQEQKCGWRGVRESRGGILAAPPQPPTLSLPLRINSGAVKCKSGQTAPPQIVGEFVLKWKWGWWRTWRLAPRLTWKEGKRQLLIFSFDLWLLLVFHTKVDLWRSLTAHCYWRDYCKRKRKRNWPQGLPVYGFVYFTLFVSIYVLYTAYVLSSLLSLCQFPFVFLSVGLRGFQTIFFHHYL